MTNKKINIYYFCPDVEFPSGGVKRLYRHVWILNNAGFSTAIVHFKRGFKIKDIPYNVDVKYFEELQTSTKDFLVFPEGLSTIMYQLPNLKGHRIIIALNWSYIYPVLPEYKTWKDLKVEFVLTHSPDIAEFIDWSMGIKSILFPISYNQNLYYEEKKEPWISYLNRKSADGDIIAKIFRAGNLVDKKFRWIGMKDLPEERYARYLRKSIIFLLVGTHEGAPSSAIEAMASGCLCVGYDGVGGKSFFVSSGEHQNSFIVENGNYFALGKKIQEILQQYIKNPHAFDKIKSNAKRFVQQFTEKREINSLIEIWEGILRKT